jgi:hypothetical protein
LRAVFEAPVFVTGLNNLAVTGQPAGKRPRHLGIASRLEGLNTDFDTSILVSETVREIAKGSFGFRSIGLITIKGPAGRIETFELAMGCSQRSY